MGKNTDKNIAGDLIDAPQWLRDQADFLLLINKNNSEALCFEQAAQEIEWLREDLHLAMRCLNVVRESLGRLHSVSKLETRDGKLATTVSLADASLTLNLISASCIEAEGISDNAIDFYNRLKAEERVMRAKEN